MLEVQQGYFGNVNRSHGVITFSFANKSLQDEMLPRTDRPFGDELDGKWPAFIWGRPLAGHYLFMRTFPDVNASRAGMVFTHALAIPMADAVQITDLRIVFSHLCKEVPDQRPQLRPILIDLNARGTKPSSPYLEDAVSRYLQGQASVTVEEEDFPELVTALWWGLPPALRRDFSFGMCMNADQLEDQGFQISLTPRSLARRWNPAKLLSSATSVGTYPAAEGMLLGIDTHIPQLMERLEIVVESKQQLQNLDKVVALLGQPTLGFDQLKALVNRVNHLAPAPTQGTQLKAELAKKMETAIRQGMLADIKKLRNLDLPGFGKFLPDFWTALQQAMKRYLESGDSKVWPEVSDVIALGWEHLDSRWSVSIHASFHEWAQHASSFKFVWEFIKAHPNLVGRIFPLIPTASDIEKNLYNSLVDAPPTDSLPALRAMCTQRKWYSLHADLVAKTMPARDAILAQISIDTAAEHLLGIGRIAEKTPRQAFFALAHEISDDRLIDLASMYCQRENQCRKWLDLTNQRGRQILLKWLNDRNGDRNVLDQATVFELLQLQLNGTQVEPGLFGHCLAHGLGNLLELPSRKDIWEVLPSGARGQFLEATARGWLEDARLHPNQIDTPEPALTTTLVSTSIIPSYLGTNPIEAALLNGVFKGFPSLPESALVAALRNRQLSGSEFDAPALGQLISGRRWENAATTLFKQRYHHRWLHPALLQISNLLGIWDRFTLSFEPGRPPVPESEFWDQLGKLAIEIYPKGPDKLFESLKWDESDLSNNDSRKEQWEHVIRLTRKGKDGYGVRKLIGGMLRDHPSNEKLKLLKTYAENHHL